MKKGFGEFPKPYKLLLRDDFRLGRINGNLLATTIKTLILDITINQSK